jgi:hypothetical protein
MTDTPKHPFWNLAEKKDKTEPEEMLCAAVNLLSTEPRFSSQTQEQVWDYIKKHAEFLFYKIPY